MLQRVLEPEVMDTEEEASDYDAMDHDGVNHAFCVDLLAANPDLSRTLDIGTGTALIPLELCRLAGGRPLHVTGIDLADHMLQTGQRNVDRAGEKSRITLERRDAKSTGLATGSFRSVVSNSLVHHVADVPALLREMWRLVGAGGLLFVRDLLRPDDEATLLAQVEQYAPITGAPGTPEHARSSRQRFLFDASLRAALSRDEIIAAATQAGIASPSVSVTSDRHFTLVARGA